MKAGRRALFLLLALGALWLLREAASGRQQEWFEVQRGDLVLSVDFEGVLRAVDAHQLGPPAVRGIWSYKIARMAPEGADVTAGTDVLSFDATELEKQLLSRRAEHETASAEIEKRRLDVLTRQRADALRLSEARAKLEKSRLKLDRPSELVAAREIRSLELDRELAEKEVAYLEERRRSMDEADRIDLESLIEQRDRALARVSELEEAISRMTLKAPRDGTVVYVVSRSDEKKRVGDTVWRHETVLAVPDLRRMAADGFVDEFDAGKIAPGQRVELRLDAYPEIVFRGRILEMGKTIQSLSRDSPLRGLKVAVALDETDTTRMRPDMRFRGKIEIARVENALLLPLAAIERREGRPVVRRVGPGGVSRVAVALGRRGGDLVEVLDGLSEGERVALFGHGEAEPAR